MNMKAITKTMKMINYFQRQIPGNGMTTNPQFQQFRNNGIQIYGAKVIFLKNIILFREAFAIAKPI